ncbi:uncharacterized protein LOC118753693, partial [Rhagoletis pomonella]|uniref:uncharacterized protein LOC118753693 n=1 Tax=Rhagoletis pomonella TaxID=28610 RepID=UPI00178573F8
MQFAAVWLLAAAATFTAFEQSEAYDIGENQINAGANALNAATQNAIGAAGVGSELTNNIGGSQVINSGSIIQGSGNTVSSLLNVDPQINAVVNALNSLNQESAAASDGASGNTIGGRQI